MKIGSVKEIKKFEYRVGLTPDNVRSYVNAGHQVYIERNAGVGSGFMTDDYIKKIDEITSRKEKELSVI